MKKKIILAGAVFTAILMIVLPSINAVNIQTITKEKTNACSICASSRGPCDSILDVFEHEKLWAEDAFNNAVDLLNDNDPDNNNEADPYIDEGMQHADNARLLIDDYWECLQYNYPLIYMGLGIFKLIQKISFNIWFSIQNNKI